MNIHRNILVVAGATLLVSLSAGAQVLGGNVGGAVNGTFGGSIGQTGIHGAGSVAGNIDASGTFEAARERASQSGRRSRDVAAGAAASASSRVGAARDAAAANVETAHSAGVRAGHGAAASAAQTSTAVQQAGAAQASTPPRGDVVIGGAATAATEQHALGRSVTAHGAAGSQVTADQSSIASSASGETRVSAK